MTWASRPAGTLHRRHRRQERGIDAVGAGLGEGLEAAQRLLGVVGAGQDAVGAGDEHEVAREGAGGGDGGLHPLDGEAEPVGARTRQVGVLDRGAAEAGLGGEADGRGDMLGVRAVAVLEVSADRQGSRGDQRLGVGEGLVAADPRAVGQAEGEGKAGRGGADRLGAERGEQAGRARIPGVHQDERIARPMQRPERGSRIVWHVRSPLRRPRTGRFDPV
jgi:hypothetical protein